MALLGTQLVITLIMVSIIQKMCSHFSLAKWILTSTGLIRYLYPADEELRSLAGIHKMNKGNKRHKHENGKIETFHIPKSLEFQMETAAVVAEDLVFLRFYPEFQWLLDFSMYSTGVYVLTEIASIFVNLKDEVNLSVVWCLLVVGFAVKVLLTLTRQYFEGEESGERSTVIVTGFSFLVLAMIILIIDEAILETGLDTAYRSFNSSASAFLERQGIPSAGPASKIVLKFFLAVWCGLIGALFTFPGLRVARMHWDALRYYSDRIVIRTVMNTSFIFPFVLTLLWIRPLARDYLTDRVFQGMTEPLMSREVFESGRLILVVIAVLIRLFLMPLYLQSYLNMAARRVEALKKEAGRITNRELQKKISAVFYYLCVVAVQFVAPLIICLFLTFLYKTLGGFTWSGSSISTDECPLSPPPTIQYSSSSIQESAQQITMALDSLKQVFTVEVFRGLLGLMTWWVCFTWCATSFMGFVYQTYFFQV